MMIAEINVLSRDGNELPNPGAVPFLPGQVNPTPHRLRELNGDDDDPLPLFVPPIFLP